jgi:hypothetical protein
MFIFVTTITKQLKINKMKTLTKQDLVKAIQKVMNLNTLSKDELHKVYLEFIVNQ